jgi:excisionase family DNA binding protein
MGKPLLGWEEAAERLGITRRHLRALRERREIDVVKVGRLIKFDPDQLDRWVEEQSQEAVS